jgi:hypothetical protein
MENEWGHLMEESFLLKHFANLSLDEQFNMTAEEREWWLKRADKEHKRDNTTAPAAATGKIPKSPGNPPI